MNIPGQGKILRVTVEYEDQILTIEGAEAEKWNQHNIQVAMMAQVHSHNPFFTDPINWHIFQKVGSEYTQQLSRSLTILKRMYDAKGIVFPGDRERAYWMLKNAGLLPDSGRPPVTDTPPQ